MGRGATDPARRIHPILVISVDGQQWVGRNDPSRAASVAETTRVAYRGPRPVQCERRGCVSAAQFRRGADTGVCASGSPGLPASAAVNDDRPAADCPKFVGTSGPTHAARAAGDPARRDDDVDRGVLGRRGAVGDDHGDWPGLLAVLDEIGYAGPLVLESFTGDNDTIATAASIWRPLAASQDELALRSIQFLDRLQEAS